MKYLVATILIITAFIAGQYYTIHKIEIADISSDAVTLKINNQYEIYNYKGGI